MQTAWKLWLVTACVLPGIAWSCSAETAPVIQPVQSSEPTPALIQPDESWIEISLERQMLVLHAGGNVVAEFPASTGVAGAPTPGGLYRVQMLERGPIENVPGVWVADILIFRYGEGIGIHSMPMDSQGRVLDPTLGVPGTAGCVRVGESRRVFEFAHLGMRVWVH